MRMPELKSLARDRRLRNYSWLRKAELVALLQNNPPPGQSRASTAPTPHTRPPAPPPPTQTWGPIDDRRPRKPSPQEMDNSYCFIVISKCYYFHVLFFLNTIKSSLKTKGFVKT